MTFELLIRFPGLAKATQRRLNMEQRAKKAVHISWEEAYRAEAEREKARQMRCRPILPTQVELIEGKIRTSLSKVKTSALHPSLVTFSQRLCVSSYNEKKSFGLEPVENFAAYSKTLLQLFKTHSRNVLFIARSASAKRSVSAGVLEKSAQNFQAPKMLYKRRPTRLAGAIFIGVLLAGIGVVSYPRYSKYSLSPLLDKRLATVPQRAPFTAAGEIGTKDSKTKALAPQVSSKNNESAEAGGPDGLKTAPDYSGNFEVVDNSFVRDQPEANATIIATLRPGTRVRIESKTGDYLRVRSLSDADVIGYVHEEDAFFQAH
jgi:hypothetical protein